MLELHNVIVPQTQTATAMEPTPAMTNQTHFILQLLANIKPDELSPKQALDLLYQLKALTNE